MIIPVVVGVIVLGRAFDLYHVTQTKYQIFDNKEIEDNLQIIPQTCSQKDYRIVKTASDVNNALKLDPYISLKVKNGDVRLGGLDTYISNIINRNKTLEIIMAVDIETETHSFPPSVQTKSGWQQKPQIEVGTHYVSSIKYGGRMLASLQLKPNNPKDFEKIEKALASKIPSSGSLDELFFSDLESVVMSVQKKTTIAINVISTVGIFTPPSSVNGLAKLVKEYPDIVSQVNGGKGLPLKFELEDLHRVQSNYTRFEIKPELEVILEEANEKFEDLRVASRILRDWQATGPILKEQEEELINAYGARLHDSKEAFSSAIRNLRYNGESDQFDEAFDVYNKLKDDSPYRYTHTIEKFIKAISDKSIFGRFYIYFIRWMKTAVGL